MRSPTAARSGCRTSSCAPRWTGGPDAPVWSERQRLLVQLADELHDTATVSESLWTKLSGHWDSAQLIELVATAGFYHLVSFTANAAGVRARGVRRAVSHPRCGPVTGADSFVTCDACCSACWYCSPSLLAVNTVVTDRDTEAAHADAGRIVDLPGGDLQVREDGPRDAPAVVMLHGFACSIGWWDQMTPALARDHRVVRFDLLGHGGSEKPKEGYGMESQARLVAAALDRLGVRRADVVGHSMGGSVATALAEQRPALVDRS